MSTESSQPTKQPQEQPIEQRVDELREIEEELRRVADSDVPYAEDAQRFLTALEEHNG